jgi:hypothetical protein
MFWKNSIQMNDPIFIVGSSRSGTTLVSRILKKHPEIHILNETHFIYEFDRFIKNNALLSDDKIWKIVNLMLTIQKKDYYRKNDYEEYPEAAKEIISEFQRQKQRNFATLNKIFFKFEAKRHGKKRAGDQTPRHIFCMHQLLKMYPDAKFVQMVRHPCAVLLSQKNKWKAGLHWQIPKFEVLRTFFNYHPVTISILWKKSVESGLEAQQIIAERSLKTIIFENLVEKPRKEIMELCDFLQIDFFPDMINVPVEMSSNIKNEGYKGISKSVSEHWRDRLSETEVFIAEKLTSHQMELLGFSSTGARPNLVKLMLYFLVLPLQLSVAFTLNIRRIGNPFLYITTRIFSQKLKNFAKTQAFKN